MIGGQLDFAFGFAAATLPHIKSGKLRALGVSVAKRLPTLPDVQTLGEAGIAGYDESGWAGYAVPADTAPERVGKLHHAFQDALRSPEFATFLDSLGYELVAGTQAEAAALVKTDYERYAKIVKVLGLRIE